MPGYNAGDRSMRELRRERSSQIVDAGHLISPEPAISQVPARERVAPR